MILSSGSTLRSSLKTRNGCRTVAVEAKDKEMMEKRRGEEATKKEHKEEEEMRRVATYRKEREKKLERARRAKAVMKEKWPRYTQ